MIGYTLYAALMLSVLLGVITMVRLFQGKGAGLWAKATGVALVIMVVAFVLWAKVEVPAYERAQAKINYQAGLQYQQAGDLDNALQSYLKITQYDPEIYATVQPLIQDLQLRLASDLLAEAKALYAQQQYQPALQALQKSLQYRLLEESQALLPVYQAAAGQK